MATDKLNWVVKMFLISLLVVIFPLTARPQGSLHLLG